MTHPVQPLITDSEGIVRFKENAIVRWLLDAGPFDMNQIAATPFGIEDREQFAQLIGYSLSGFGDLSYVRDETYNTASLMHETGKTEAESRIEALETTLENAKVGMRTGVAALFGIDPDDLRRSGS